MLEQKFIDLHTHSTASDGTVSPCELVKLAKKASLTAIALTDHDTTEGLSEFLEAGKREEIETIAGIEFACWYQGTEIHIVGLWIEPENPFLQQTLSHLRSSRLKRNQKMIENLNTLGIPVTYPSLEQIAGGNIITRAHYASYLIEKGYVCSKQEAFEKYLSPGCAVYERRETFLPSDCIFAIKQAGGIAILAHPTLYGLSYTQLACMCSELKQWGLIGIETMYSTYTSAQAHEINCLAKRLSLLPSGGSDFHGSIKPGIFLGVGRGNLRIPYSFLKDLKNEIKRNLDIK